MSESIKLESDQQSSVHPNELDELAELDLSIAEIEPRLQRSQKLRRNLAVGLSVIFALSGIIAGVFREDLFGEYDGPNTGQIVAITLAATIIGPIYIYFITGTMAASRQREYEQLLAKRRVIAELTFKQSADSPEEVTYFDRLVQINVSNLAEYYTLVKVHTDNSFRVSLAAGSVGFLLIAVGMLVGFTNNANMKAMAYVSSGVGVITEFIAGVFFYLYNRTVGQLKDYHDSLIAVQDVLLSFKIIGDIADEKDKVKMVSQMLAFLIGNRSKPNEQTKDA